MVFALSGKRPGIVLGLSTIMLACFAFTPSLSGQLDETRERETREPSIIVILADDMGYSDAGFAGGEISTPNLDRLAATGVVLPNFYNSARCFPTRASLLTGRYHHSVGMGGRLQMLTASGEIVPQMPAGPYQGYLDLDAPTLPEILRKAGYQNYIVGKWHLGIEQDNWPTNRGFDRYFGPVTGIDNYFGTHGLNAAFQRFYLDDDEVWTTDDPSFYATDAFSDQAATYVREHAQRNPDNPFFLYVAYTAPHWPLQARETDIAKYEQVYSRGWDEIRADRIKKAKQKLVVAKDVTLPPRPEAIPAWEELSVDDQTVWARRMAVYAAMIEVMDHGVGRIIEALEETAQRENTLIVFFSDNGAAAIDITQNEAYSELNLSASSIGAPGSADSVRRPWAFASNTPYRRYKSEMYEGGTKTPLLLNWPAQIEGPSIQERTSHVIDLAPTILNLADIEIEQNDPLPGINLMQTDDAPADQERWLYWEHFGHRAVRKGPWKLVGDPNRSFPELFNLSEDPTEQVDLLSEQTTTAVELAKAWSAWANEEGLSNQDWNW